MPILSSAVSLTNTTLLGNQVDPAVVVLDNGNTIFSWSEGNNIVTRTYNAAGVAVGNDVVLNTGGVVSNVVLTETADGGFIVGWNGATDVLGRKYSSASVDSGATTDFSGTVAGNQGKAGMTALADGSIVVSFHTAGVSSFKIVNSTLSNAASATVVNIDATANAANPASVTALADGSFAVSYVKSISGSDEVVFKVYDATGAVLVNQTTLNTILPNNQFAPALAALSNGSFVATWHTDGGAAVGARIVNADGSFATAQFAVQSTAGTNMKDATVTQLADGSILFVWDADGNIKGRLFNSSGVALADDFTVDASTGLQTNPEVKALSDGRFIVTFDSDDTLDGGGNGIGIRHVTMDPSKFNGTSAAETWGGGELIDTMYGYAGADELSGNGGNDYLNGGDDADTLNGGSGNDTLVGDNGNDALNGGTGNDKLFAGTASSATGNTLKGEDGDDTLYAGSGVDKMTGGSGSDTLSYYYSTSGVSVDITTSTEVMGGGAAGDVLSDSFENLEGSALYNDTLIGNGGSNVLKGHGGNDTLTGAGGLDTLYGGNGNDIMSGGDSDDKMYGDAGNDTINGGAGNDSLYGGAGNDAFTGGNDVDTVSYYSSTTGATAALDASIVSAGSAAGDTFNTVENINGSNNGDDTLSGDAGANVIKGYIGNDTIYGRFGNDTIDGGAGDDYMSGSDGDDKFTGGGGNDRYYGGAGKDTYTSSAADADIYMFVVKSNVTLGGEAINAFNVSEDLLEFNITGASSFAATGLAAGTLNTANFKLRATDNIAQDANDYFIFQDNTNQLWYDADGNAGGAAVMIVDIGLMSGQLTAADIELVI